MPMVIDDLKDKKLFFASDFHLGAPSRKESRAREDKIVRWLEHVRSEAHTIFLMGDIFDFWFEYRHVIPKGFIRLQGKLAELSDAGIPIVFFTGNHDMWMFGYFTEELNIRVYRHPLEMQVGKTSLLIGHGDGLGPGDHTYKFLKRIFNNPVCQWLFARIHPNAGMGLAHFWSKRSRISNNRKEEDDFKGEKEYLVQYCRAKEAANDHHDYYVFGHRHLPLNIRLNESSRYINLGEWVNYGTYASFDGSAMELLTFEE